jgi:ABC-type transport system, involved in lipoprotein release, permease component
MKSWMPFEWIAAMRFLAEGRMQTTFILVGAAIGVAVIVFLSAILTGMQQNIIRRSLLSQAHIVIQPAEEVARPQPRGVPGGESRSCRSGRSASCRSTSGRRS